jgi:hypothetical protein
MTGDGTPIFFHRDARPETCEVCLWIRDNDGDQLLEHTKTRICMSLLLDDLREARHPVHMQQLHRAGFGFPGPDHPLEPRHWLWALLLTPAFMITLDEEKLAQEGMPA